MCLYFLLLNRGFPAALEYICFHPSSAVLHHVIYVITTIKSINDFFFFFLPFELLESDLAGKALNRMEYENNMYKEKVFLTVKELNYLLMA